MTERSRRVVLTGAGGLIGRAIAPLLPAGWDLLRTDLRAADGISALDVTDADACRAAFTGADAVVHLAAVPDPDASWEQLLPANVVGAHQVARAAGECGVRRLVLASSLQAVSGDAGRDPDQVDRPAPPGQPVRSDQGVGGGARVLGGGDDRDLGRGPADRLLRPAAAGRRCGLGGGAGGVVEPARRRRAGARRGGSRGPRLRRRQRHLRQPLPPRRPRRTPSADSATGPRDDAW